MKSNKVAVPVGIEIETGAILSIHDLDNSKRGLLCNLKCPNEACSDRLKAVFTKTENHSNYLSHYRKVASAACEETALHHQGKKLLASQSLFKTSAYNILPNVEYTDMLGITCPYTAKPLFDYTPITFIGPRCIEKTIQNDVRIQGDLVVPCEYESHRLDVNFEIKATHAVDEQKLAKIKALDITTIEIDVSKLLGQGALHDSVVLKAILEPENHKVLHLKDSIAEHYKHQEEIFFKQKITAMNYRRKRWLWEFKQLFNNRTIRLPEYDYGGDYGFESAPWSPRNNAQHLAHLEPMLPKDVKAIGLTHDGNNSFTITVEINAKPISIPMIIRRSDEDLEEMRRKGESFLYIELDNVHKASSVELHWGFNSKAEAYLDAIRSL